MRTVVLALFSVALMSCASGKDTNSNTKTNTDQLAWDSTVEAFNYSQICQDVPKIWVLPVAQSKRDEAISKLKNTKSVSLNESMFYSLHSLSPTAGISIPQALFNEAYDWLRNNPDDTSFRFCQYSSGKQCADELAISLGTRPRDSSAHLIRAVAKHEQTGAYSVSECEDGVYIHHSSLGPDIEPIKTPVIVVLIRPPRDVIASAGTAL